MFDILSWLGFVEWSVLLAGTVTGTGSDIDHFVVTSITWGSLRNLRVPLQHYILRTRLARIISKPWLWSRKMRDLIPQLWFWLDQIWITSHRDAYNSRWRRPMIHTNFCNCQLQSGCICVQNLRSVGHYQHQCDANIEDLLKFTAKHNWWSHLWPIFLHGW